MERRASEQDEAVGYANLAGRLALDLITEQENLNKESGQVLAQGQKDRLGIMADKLIVITSKGLVETSPKRETFLPLGYMIEELIYLSKGYPEQARAAAAGIDKNRIKSRYQGVKRELGTRSRAHSVAEGIQRGYIPIQVEDSPSFKPLSWMEAQVLSYSAAGWSTNEIASYYDISPNTVDRYGEQVRGKLGANNMPKAVRRAFEVGIFRVGEPISIVKELDLEVKVTAEVESAAQVIISDHRQIKLLRIMAAKNTGWISSGEAIKAGFYEGVSSVAQQFQFGRMMLALADRLEEAMGKPMIAKRKVRIEGERTSIYLLNEQLTIEIGNETQIIPRYPLEEAEKWVRERQQAGRPSAARSYPKAAPKKNNPEPKSASSSGNKLNKPVAQAPAPETKPAPKKPVVKQKGIGVNPFTDD